MKLLFLGTGAADGIVGKPLGDPSVRRFSSALIDGDLLLDPGPHIFDFAHHYGEEGLYQKVKYILCTHSHPDHFCSDTVATLLSLNPELTLYGDEAIRRKLARQLPEVAEQIHFLPLRHGEWVEFGDYRVLPTRSNHSTGDAEEITLHHTIEKGGRRLFYGLDGAWLLRESWNLMRALEGPYHAMIFDATCGERADEFRIFEHNTIPMLHVMLDGMRAGKFHAIDESTVLVAHHMARTLHEDHDTLSRTLAPLGMTVAYDGLTLTI